MKFLLVPENNSLSHIAKAIAIRNGLLARGHEVLLAVGQRWTAFLDQIETPYAVLPDIQERDGAGFPSVDWFRDAATLRAVIDEERRLLESYRPDRVLGIFRFTLKAAAQLASVRYDSLISGCLLPDACNAYGYAQGESGARQQAELMSGFFRYAGARLSRVMAGYGLARIEDAREMLLGERTFLWDFPEFCPVELPAGCVHVGAITWTGWPDDRVDWENFQTYQERPLAVLSFGTCVGDGSVADYITRILGELGFHVLLAAGGQQHMSMQPSLVPWLTVSRFAPLHRLWTKASLLVSHGGQMTTFEALKHRVPVAVMPFQPEQAHNGVCLEALGCGRRLAPGQPFLGNPKVYEEALHVGGAARLHRIFSELLTDRTAQCITQASLQMGRYRGLADLLPRLEAVT
ncbi:MAG TPA: glycosyltransferase [Malonomonas sp.]